MASRPPTVTIDESDFPALYHAADRNSLDGQRRFLTATQLRLVMLVVAAVFGLITWRRGRADLAAVVAGTAFSVALVAEVYLLRRRPDRLWYDGRQPVRPHRGLRGGGRTAAAAPLPPGRGRAAGRPPGPDLRRR
jgi:hypothetical protein